MSAPLRPGPSSWRRAASVVLAAGWTRPSPATPAPADGFRLLFLQRSPSQRFLPGAHVFPGGVLDAADSSPEWLRLFAPRHTPPRFGLGPAPRRQHPFPGLFQGDADGAALPDDVALRICAIRETFEEAGVLLLRPRGSAPAPRDPGLALSPPPGLAAWRSRVRNDPRCFVQLCAHLDCTPDIWALHDWSGWLTPYGRSSRRFDTTFLLCCLRETPRVDIDLAEVVDYKVGRRGTPGMLRALPQTNGVSILTSRNALSMDTAVPPAVCVGLSFFCRLHPFSLSPYSHSLSLLFLPLSPFFFYT